MTDPSRPTTTGPDGEVTVYRPSADGGLEPVRGDGPDYRAGLRSRRWNAAPLENREIEPSDPRIVLGGIAALLVLTFVVIVAGHASGFWG